MRLSLLISIFIFSLNSFACPDALNFNLRKLDSDDTQSLCEFSNKTVLIVNVASKCGYTPQYEGLQKIYSKYKDQGFTVIGIPSRDFLFQEFSDESEVAEFCSTEFGVTFPMFATSKVKGSNAIDLFKFLSRVTGEEPKWNFNKYLITKDGEVSWFHHKVEPESNQLVEAIEALL
ncbi:MAG: glutathione peroxidase [Gammaproteobacteria bacterium]